MQAALSSLQDSDLSVDSLETIQVSKEAPWDKQGEDLLRVWLATAKRESDLHRKKGYTLKSLYKFFGIVSILTAAIVFLVANLDSTENTLRFIIVSFINLIVVNLTSFLDYGPKYQRQFEFEGKYTKISIDIEEILALDQDYRAPKDRTLAEYKEKIGNLRVNAPEL